MNMREYLGTQWSIPEFLYFIARAAHPLLSGASVQIQLLAQRESAMGGPANRAHLWGAGGGGFEPVLSNYLVNNYLLYSPGLP